MGCAASTGVAGAGSEPHKAQQPQQQPQSQPAPAEAASQQQEQQHAETNDDEHPQPPAAQPAAPAPAPVVISPNPHHQQEGGPPGLPSPLGADALSESDQPESPGSVSMSQQEGRPGPAPVPAADAAQSAAVQGSKPAAAAADVAPLSASAPAIAPAPAMADGPKPPPRTIGAHEHSLQFHSARYNGVFTCDVCKVINEGESYTCVPCEFDVCLVCLEKAAPGGEVASGPRDGSVTLAAHEHPLHEFKNRYPEHGGAFKCDLCGTHGSGRSWSCPKEECGWDIHPHCMLIAERRG